VVQLAIHYPNAGHDWLCKNAAYPVAIEELKQDKTLKAETELRQNKYLNNVIKQDYRDVKRIVKPMMGFQSFNTAKKTLRGIKTMAMVRKGQVSGLPKFAASRFVPQS